MVVVSPLSSAFDSSPHPPMNAPTAALSIAGAATVAGPSPPMSSPSTGASHSDGTPAPSTAAKPEWWDVSSESTTPFPIEEFTQGTWDGADGGVLLYGGDDYNVNLNGTWMYDTGQWTELATQGNPGPLSGASLAYDPETGYSVLYGGVSSYSPLSFNNTTYYYSHGTWSAHSLPGSPPVPLAGQMVYDPALGGIVLFGGEDDSTSLVQNQTWLFDNGSWSKLPTPHAPPPRWISQMAYDPALGELVLYGGFDQGGNWLGDTWVFANGTWSSVNAQGLGVPPLGAGNLVYDSDLGSLLLVGGINQLSQQEVGAWAFNGSVWSVLATQGGSHGHSAGIGVWDPLDHELVLAGGGGPGSPSFTDVLSIPLTPVNVTAPLETDIGVVANFSASAIGGAPPYTYSWNWGDDTTNSTANATHVYQTAGAFVITLTVRGPASNPATWQREITVAAGPVPKLVSATKGIDVGLPVSLTATSSGGVGPFRFSWALSDGGTGSGPVLNHTFSQPGDVALNITALDSAGGRGSALYLLMVNATPSVGIAPVNSPEAGAVTVFQAAVSGGSPPFTYAWQFAGGATVTGASPKHTFPSAGEQTVTVNVTDVDGVSTQTTTTVGVVPGVVVAIEGPTSVDAGAAPTFTANVSLGVQPYNVTWTLPSGAVENGTTAVYNFPGTGVFEISVKVVDGNHVVAVSSLNVTVGTGSNTVLGGSIGGVPAWALIAGVAAIVVVGAAALAISRRRPPKTPDGEPASPEPEAQ